MELMFWMLKLLKYREKKGDWEGFLAGEKDIKKQLSK